MPCTNGAHVASGSSRGAHCATVGIEELGSCERVDDGNREMRKISRAREEMAGMEAIFLFCKFLCI